MSVLDGALEDLTPTGTVTSTYEAIVIAAIGPATLHPWVSVDITVTDRATGRIVSQRRPHRFAADRVTRHMLARRLEQAGWVLGNLAMHDHGTQCAALFECEPSKRREELTS